MPTERSYTEEVKRFSEIVDRFSVEMRDFREYFRVEIDKLHESLSDVQRDADIITEGDRRHGLKPLRAMIDNAMIEAQRANARLDRIYWMASGVAIVAGIVSSIAFNIVQMFL